MIEQKEDIRIDIPADQRPEVTRVVSSAVKAAENYTGTQNSYDTLCNLLTAFEACAKELVTGASSFVVREEALAAELIAQRVSTASLLDMAIAAFGRHLAVSKTALTINTLDYVLIPPDGLMTPMPFGPTTGDAPIREEPRTLEVIKLLNSHRIFTNDLVIYQGSTRRDQVRKSPYTLIQIPHLNREILVCDQVGEATFVGVGLKGGLFWATYSKAALTLRDDVHRIIYDGSFAEKLLKALFENNEAASRLSLTTFDKQFPVTADLVLLKALQHASRHEGVLPNRKSGAILGLAKETWSRWHLIILERTCGFDIEGLGGLADLYRRFGLVMGRTVNPKMVEQGIANIVETGIHGLRLIPEQPLTADFILAKALEHAGRHDGKLPTAKSGTVIGLPGQNWATWESAIINKGRGFDIDDVAGLRGLYNLYGLKFGKVENAEIVARALRNIAKDGHHGLERQNERPLTADLILRAALAHAAANDGRLPRQTDDVLGMPGQKWNNWTVHIRNQTRGFDIAGIAGLTEFYNHFGLKMETRENTALIAQAIERMNKSGDHGLRPVAQQDLTADFILHKALEHAAKHNGQLPSQHSGDVIGLPGQNWATWSLSITRKIRGFDMPDIAGLGDLYNHFGLKRLQTTDPEVVARAVANMNATGHHGLVPVERQQITADLILRAALKYAATHDGRLPASYDGDVEGMQPYTWARYNTILARRLKDPRLPDLRGLGDLYNRYGLKTGLKPNTEIIERAIKNLAATGDHGLTVSAPAEPPRPACTSAPSESGPRLSG